MKNFLRFGFVLLFVLGGFDGVGQMSCGTPSPTIKQGDKIMKSIDSFEKLKLSSNIVTQYIPIQFHNIIPASGGGGVISASYIANILEKLNFWYSNARVSFYSLGSVNTISNTSLYNFNDASFISLIENYGHTNAINIFFVGSINGSAVITGEARFPLDVAETYSLKNSNGIVIGKNFPESYLAEKTVPHEMGHYFGLYHTHETEFGAELVNGSNSSTAGDRITDTPADPNRTGCVILCIYSTFCSSRDANNQKYSPQVNNIMSYYDNCGGLITSGQYSRVQWGKYVRNILNPNLYQRYYLDGVRRTILQYSGSTSLCAGNNISMTLNSYGEPSYYQGRFYLQLKSASSTYFSNISSDYSSTNGGVYITGTIPSNTPTGYYQVRIYKTESQSYGDIEEKTIYVNGSSSGVIIENSVYSNLYLSASSTILYNATSTCAGNSIALYGRLSGYDSYWWTKDGLNYTASSTSSSYLSAIQTGTYTLNMAKCNNVYRSSNSIYLNFYDTTIPSITASSNGQSTDYRLTTCEGSPVTLSTNCSSVVNPIWSDGSTSSIRYINASSTRDFMVNCNNYFCNTGYSPAVRITALNPNVQSTKTGNWQDVTLWTSNLVPLSCQTVTIQTGHTVNVPINDAKAKNIIIRGNLNFQNVSPTIKGKVGLGI